MRKKDNKSHKHCTKLSFYAIKEHKGITLIVLTITIVVLLILAGITVANITGGDGIMEHATSKKDEATIASEKAILGNALIEATDKFGNITESKLSTALSNINVDITKTGTSLFTIRFKDTNNEYKLNNEGNCIPFYVTSTLKGCGGSETYNGEYYAYRTTITKITFENKITGKEGATKIWDVSEANDGSCMAYLVGTELFIQTDGIVSFPEDSSFLFFNFTNVDSINGFEYTDTSNVTSMMNLFGASSNSKPTKIKSLPGIEYWDTSNVENMSYMFNRCFYLESINLSNFNTSKVTSMKSMFQHNYSLTTLDVSSFDTKNVVDMTAMFGCGIVSRITKLKEIKGLQNFDTSNTTSLRTMFVHQINLETLDLSSFDTSLVEDMSSMFDATNLKTIYVSNNFTTDAVTNSERMFARTSTYFGLSQTPTLVGGCGTVWDENHIDVEYARIDDPANNRPGYFTLKEN